MYYKFTYLFLLSFAISLLIVACAEKEKPGIRMAKQWCECNKPIVPLQYNLEQATSSGQRQAILDSMRLLTAEVMQCMGGESEIVKLDQEMTDADKDEFNKTFRRVREETCPEVFQAISNMENSLLKEEPILKNY